MIYKGFNSKFLKVTRADRHLKKAEDDNGRPDGCIFFSYGYERMYPKQIRVRFVFYFFFVFVKYF